MRLNEEIREKTYPKGVCKTDVEIDKKIWEDIINGGSKSCFCTCLSKEKMKCSTTALS